MQVELVLTGSGDAHVIRNLWPLYLHDVSAFDGRRPNAHGLLADDEQLTSLAEQGETLAGWWKHPELFFPYLITADGRPAGFDLVAGRGGFPDAIDAEVVVHEFFVLHAYRGRGVGEQAALQGFERHPGRWEVVTYPGHERAIAFWRRVISGASAGVFTEGEEDHPWGRKVAFRFDNTA